MQAGAQVLKINFKQFLFLAVLRPYPMTLSQIFSHLALTTSINCGLPHIMMDELKVLEQARKKQERGAGKKQKESL